LRHSNVFIVPFLGIFAPRFPPLNLSWGLLRHFSSSGKNTTDQFTPPFLVWFFFCFLFVKSARFPGFPYPLFFFITVLPGIFSLFFFRCPCFCAWCAWRTSFESTILGLGVVVPPKIPSSDLLFLSPHPVFSSFFCVPVVVSESVSLGQQWLVTPNFPAQCAPCPLLSPIPFEMSRPPLFQGPFFFNSSPSLHFPASLAVHKQASPFPKVAFLEFSP